MPKTANKIPVVVFNDNISAYGVCRALGPMGIPLYLISKGPYQFSAYSRYIKGKTIISPFDSNFINNLVSWIFKNAGADVVLMIAGDDDYFEVLSKNYNSLPNSFLKTFPEWSVAQNVLYKNLTYKIADRVGVACPQSAFIDTEEKLFSFLANNQILFPWLLKSELSNRFDSKYGFKGIICENEDEVVDAYKKHDGFFSRLLISEYIPGGEDSLFNFIGVFNKMHDPELLFLNKKIRSTQKFASCTLMESMWNEDVLNLSLKLAKELKYFGYFNPEFKYDPRDSKYKLMEINGRITKSNSHALKANLNIVYALYSVALGHNNYDATLNYQPYPKKVHWWYPAGDLGSIFYMVKNAEFSPNKYIKSFKGIKRVIVEPVNWRDPLPLIINLFETLVFGVKEFWRLILKKHRK